MSISSTWWGFWTANMSLHDVGFTLTSNSMNSFQRSSYVLMWMWFYIIIGNTGFPVMLRFCIWVTSYLVPKKTGFWEELRFLLDHPRRCFTLLFPSAANWWLFWVLVGLNSVDLILFVVLDVSPAHLSANRDVMSSLTLLEAWFRTRQQAARKHPSCGWFISSRLHSNCWIFMHQSGRPPSCSTGVIHHHDVHLCVSHRHFHSTNKCVRREVTGRL